MLYFWVPSFTDCLFRSEEVAEPWKPDIFYKLKSTKMPQIDPFGSFSTNSFIINE